jgi:arylsulfatase A-like enzyme
MTYLFRDYVIDFLDKATHQRKPFLLVFAPNAPHPPYTPAKEDSGLYTDLPPFRPPNYNEADMSDKPLSVAGKALLTEEDMSQIDKIRRRQILTLVALDRSMAEILTKLQESGEMDNTVIMFISDNGKHWGEHRLESKSTAYEESVKVPFAMRYPALIPTPYVEDRLVSNIDIAPTIYELSDTPIPGTVDGMSMVKLLSGTGDWRDHILLEAWPDRGHWTAVHTGQYVYIETDNDLSEFYDLAADPYQMDNRINDPGYQSIIQELQADLQKEKVPRTTISGE